MGGVFIDYEHDSEEIVALKKQILNEENKAATLQDLLHRSEASHEETRRSLTETTQKLQAEADQAVRLSSQLDACNEELNSERVRRQNFEMSIESSNSQLKDDAVARKQLQATLESVSLREQEATRALAEAHRVKASLEIRLRDLEANLQQVVNAATPGRHGRGRPRASSTSGLHVSALEREIAEVRANAIQQQMEVQRANEVASAARADAVRAENEAIAIERRLKAQVQGLQEQLSEREEELVFLSSQHGGSLSREREAELIQRIEQEESKVADLMLDSRNMHRLEVSLANTEKRLKAEIAKVKGIEGQNITLRKERDESRRSLEAATEEMQRYEDALRAKAAQIASLNDQQRLLRTEMDRLAAENAVLQDRSDSDAPDEAQRAATVQNLLNSVSRLRNDRDGLRRDLQFSQAEAKFKIQSLEKKIIEFSSTPSARRTLARLSRISTASLVAVMHLGSLHDSAIHNLQQTLEALRAEKLQSGDQIAELEFSLSRAQAELESRSSQLAESTNQHVELNAVVAQLRSHINELADSNLRARTDAARVQGAFDQNEARIGELLRSLDSVEAERDSLSNQILSVQQELGEAMARVSEGEARYIELQNRQLSTLSSDALMHTFQEQIQEYKDRVERRSEQILKHQHDIKRLEANQRLQEERLTELNNDLDVALSEKENLIEDCAEAREARDAAVQHAEELELELENAESSLRTLEAHRRDETAALVGIWAGAATKTKTLAGRFAAILQEADSRHSTVIYNLRVAEEQRSLTASVSDDRAAQLASARREVETLASDCRQSVIALALSQSSLRRAEQVLMTERSERSALETQLHAVEENLRMRVAEVAKLHSLLDGLRSEASLRNSTSHAAHAAKVEELEGQIQRITYAVSELEISKTSLSEELVAAEQKHREALQREEATARRLSDEMEMLQHKHAAELEPALARLEAITKELEETQLTHSDELTSLQTEISELSSSKLSLAEQLRHALDQVEESGKVTADLSSLSAARADEIGALQEELSRARKERGEAQEKSDRLHAREMEELSAARSALEAQVAELETSIQSLEESITTMKTDLKAELAASTESLSQANVRIKSLEADLLHAQNEHEEELRMSRESRDHLAHKLEETQAHIAELNADLVESRESLQGVEASLELAREARDNLDKANTSLQSDIHDLLLAKEAADKDMVDCERQLDQARADLTSTSEQLGKLQYEVNGSRVQLSLRQQEIDDLHKKVAVLQSRPSSDDTIRELREQVKEMDILMSRKNEEIEGNDDIRLALLKEKKKLTSKVDSLTRKVQSLQTKLSAAREAASALPSTAPALSTIPTLPTQTPGASSSRPTHSTHHTPPIPFAPPLEIPPVPPVPAGISPISPRRRGASGPSSMSRGHIPELQPSSVFRRAQTPEPPKSTPRPYIQDKMPTTSTIGQKRAAPDDLEDDRGPAQGFTCEGTLDRERGGTEVTPRARKSLRSGFTPMRNTTARPMTTIGSTSPVRRTDSGPIFISDVTNSPRGSSAHVRAETAPATKRAGGWTSRLKSNNNAARGTVSSMKSLFERGS